MRWIARQFGPAATPPGLRGEWHREFGEPGSVHVTGSSRMFSLAAAPMKPVGIIEIRPDRLLHQNDTAVVSQLLRDGSVV